MRHARSTLIVLVLLTALSACNGASDGPAAPRVDAGAAPPAATADVAAAGGDATTARASVTPGGVAGAALVDRDGTPVPQVAFDPDSVPVTQGALGALPVFSMPRGYRAVNRARTRAYARFPFRLGHGVHWVEGPSWSAAIGIDRDAAPGKDYSPLEVRRNLEAVLEQAGGRRVYDGPLQRDVYYGSLKDEIGHGYIDAVNYDATTPTAVFVIRRADRTVWVQLAYDGSSTGVVAVDEQPFRPTARWSGEFPYLILPAGYDQRDQPLRRDYDAFPFWTGAAFEEVEGKAYAIAFDAEEDTTSMHEVRRHLEAMMAEAGGALVHAGPVPVAASEGISFERKSPYGNAAGYSWDEDDRSTWRVDLDDGRQVWIHARLDPLIAGWVVVEREGFQQTAALLPADALKQGIAEDGRVAIAVNFAVDKADILPDSQPQLDQVVALLRDDRSLRLSIDGHTDASGDAARNKALSLARAQSVMASLVEAGIVADRLRATGHGAERAVADNATDAGKALNRRVELVRL